MLQRDLPSITQANCIPMSLELRAGLREQNGLFFADIPFALEIAGYILQNERSAWRNADGFYPRIKVWQSEERLNMLPQTLIACADAGLGPQLGRRCQADRRGGKPVDD